MQGEGRALESEADELGGEGELLMRLGPWGAEVLGILGFGRVGGAGVARE